MVCRPARHLALLSLSWALCVGCTKKEPANVSAFTPPASSVTVTSSASPSSAAQAVAAGVALIDPVFVEGRWSPELLSGTPKRGGQLVVRLTAEPPSLNGLVDSDLWLTRMTKPAVYETLLRVDGEVQPEYPLKPCLATSYEVSPDHLTYTFHLRKGVRFHDGGPFLAQDVISTFNTLMNPKLRGQTLRAQLEGLLSWKALDEQTVQFVFKEPHFLALRQLATTIPIFPAKVLDALKPEELNGSAAINRVPVGTGPWKFESWEAGQKITFVRNDDYWDDSRKPYLDRLVFRVVLDNTVAYQLMQKGELDVLSNLTPDQWLQMQTDATALGHYRRFRYYDNNYGFIAWNEKRPFFADKRVRLALAKLFDQDAFNDNVLHGLEMRTSCAFYTASSACDAALKPVAFDPEGARALLKEAGWIDHDGDGVLDKDGVPFRFRFLFPANSAKLNKLSAVLQEAYRKAGIEMEIDKSEWAVMSKRLTDHDFDATSLLWGSSDVEIDPYQVWHSSQAQGGSNYISFADSQADKLIEQGRRELDEKARNAIWQKLGRELYEQQPYLWLTTRPELDAVKRSFRGVRPGVVYYDFARWWVE
jgi:peptide/nickel transport system substrate-binding protein